MSKFKKVSSDKTCTTMRHEDGHEIKIAHKALSALQRKQLEKMPAVEHFDDGGTAAAPSDVTSALQNAASHPQSTQKGLWDTIKGAVTPSPTPSNQYNGGEIKHYDEGTASAGNDSASA